MTLCPQTYLSCETDAITNNGEDGAFGLVLKPRLVRIDIIVGIGIAVSTNIRTSSPTVSTLIIRYSHLLHKGKLVAVLPMANVVAAVKGGRRRDGLPQFQALTQRCQERRFPKGLGSW